MATDTSAHKKNLENLRIFFQEIICDIRKELKNEHLKNDPSFARKFLPRSFPKITSQEMAEGYRKAIDEDYGNIAEIVSTCWLIRHGDIYHYFADKLSEKYADFSTIEEIEPSFGKSLSLEAIELFGAPDTYIFAVLNGCAFDKDTFETLRASAEEELHAFSSEKTTASSEKSSQEWESLLKKTIDKYEKKLSGLQRKYLEDTKKMHKQINKLKTV